MPPTPDISHERKKDSKRDLPLLARDYDVLEQYVPVLRLFQQVYSFQEPAVDDSWTTHCVGWRRRDVGSADSNEKFLQHILEYSVEINRSPSGHFERTMLTNTRLESKKIKEQIYR